MVLEQFGNSEQLKQLLSAGKDLQEQKQVLSQIIKLLENEKNLRK
jgi:hypothetical protein